MNRIRQTVAKLPANLLSPIRLVRAIVKLSLHFIPVIGPVALVISDGPNYSRKLHARYFELRAFDDGQKRQFVRERRGQYLGFGIVASGLESLPFMGLVFSFTNTVGAALWAVELEKERRQQESLVHFDDPRQQKRKLRRVSLFPRKKK
jgi:uncharacterized protein involved in cysteine biosynthesis